MILTQTTGQSTSAQTGSESEGGQGEHFTSFYLSHYFPSEKHVAFSQALTQLDFLIKEAQNGPCGKHNKS